MASMTVAWLLGFGLLASPAWAYLDWQVFQDDDGSMDSHWGCSAARYEVLRKTFVLDKPAGAQDALVQYRMGGNPYHSATRLSYSKPKDGVAWNDMLILVNDMQAVRGSPIELATEGWHKVKIDPRLLKPGENTIDFTWAVEGIPTGRGVMYLGIDTATHKRRSWSSRDRGKTFTSDTLRPNCPPDPKWQGEYMVRLQVARAGSEGPAFTDDFDRSDVMGPDWLVKGGRWDMRPGNLRGNGPGALLMCIRPFQTPLRIEYDCYSDRPGDLSLELRKKLDERGGCFVGFGAENNTLDKIDANGPIAVSKERLIELGRKHKVVVTVGDGGAVTQTIDGRQTLAATVPMLPKRLFFGLSVWQEGVFSHVKVFSARAAATAAAPADEKVAAVRRFWSFNDGPLGPVADKQLQARAEAGCSVNVVDVPTWVYFRAKGRGYTENVEPTQRPQASSPNKGSRFVPDPCLELVDGGAAPDKHAAVTLPIPAMKKGFVEFDVMADHCEDDGLRIRLGDKAGLWIDRDGRYLWQAGTQTIKLIERVQLYHSIHGDAPFTLQPQKWFTIRIEFDLQTSLASVAMVKMFNGVKEPQTEYLPVGEELPLPLDAVKGVTFATGGKGRFLVDNVFAISRTEDLSSDELWHAPARQIMKAYYPLRKDPIYLKTWSMRNIRFQEGSGTPAGDELEDLRTHPEQYATILSCAEQYNRIMVRQAFVGEKMRGLERAWFYAHSVAGDYSAKAAEARGANLKAEHLLGELYEFYAACYLDHLDQDRLKEGFGPRYEALKAALDSAETAIQATRDAMRADVIRRTKTRFSPYALEPVNPRSLPLKFADGAFRRPDGKRDFVFVRGARFLWPSMEEILRFTPLSPLGVGSHLITVAPEPEYVKFATTSWAYHCMTSPPLRSEDRVALRVEYGEHNHQSTLPGWWVEKHKHDRDIFLQTSKGEIFNRSDSSAKQLNYWNPDVLAAQKATLEALADWFIKYGWADRVAYLDLAQEAYYQIATSGGSAGTWETGYNPTAVAAFRARLKGKYRRIETLNGRWGSKYASFEEIRPPEDWGRKPERVPGLTCEFERFRQDSWHAWLKQCQAWFNSRLGRQVPASCQITYNGETCVNSLDWVKLFDTFNIVMEHYYQQFEDRPLLHRYLDCLRQVVNGTTGIGEWYVSGPGDIFDEEAIRNNGLRQTCQQVQWGRSALVYWQGHDFMFIHNGNATENRLGHTLLRYSAAFIPLGIARAEAHRAVYLECPLAQADVGIIESESSFYNAWSSARGGELAALLDSRGHDYGCLFERFIMDGRQPLVPYKLLILPDAGSLPDAFVDKLLDWVRGGGVLLTTGPTGVTDELGSPSGRFLNAVLGAERWVVAKGKLSVKKGTSGVQLVASDSYQQPGLIRRDVGRGKVLLRLSAVSDSALYDAIGCHAPRKFYAAQNRFHLAMRDGAREGLYLSALNPSCYDRLQDEIVLAGQYREVTDVSNNFPIIPRIEDGKTSFTLSLAPAESVMIRIRP